MMLSVEAGCVHMLITFKSTEAKRSRHCCSVLSIADRQASMVQSHCVALQLLPTSGITISLIKILEEPLRIAGIVFWSMSRACQITRKYYTLATVGDLCQNVWTSDDFYSETRLRMHSPLTGCGVKKSCTVASNTIVSGTPLIFSA